MFRNYLIITFRSLLKNKLFISINVLGMGVAVACCIVSYLNWDFNYRYDSHHQHAASVYRVQFWQNADGQRNRYAVVPVELGNVLMRNPDIDHVVRYTTSRNLLRVGDDVFTTEMAYADTSFFDLFTFRWRSGNAGSLRQRSSILISDAAARKYFGTEDAVGKTLTRIDHGQLTELEVGGVFEEQPLNSSFAFEAIAQWDGNPDLAPGGLSDWRSLATLFLEIKDPSRLPAVTKELQHSRALQNQAREDLQAEKYYLENFKGLAAQFHNGPWLNGDQLRSGMPPSAVIAPGVMSILLLLLAAFNFTNTTIAVSGRRLKEIGIRQTMGGLRAQLIAQFLGESLLLCFLALITGLLLAGILVPAYNSFWPNVKLTLSYTENISFFFFLSTLLVLTALIAGLYPAFYISSFKPVAVLKGKTKLGGTNWLTRTLLTFQFTVSLLALVCGYAYIRNADFQRDYDLGYATRNVIVAPVQGEAEFVAFRNALLVNRDIRFISGSKGHVSDLYEKGPVKSNGVEHMVEAVAIGDDYLEAMNIRVIQGRGFMHDSESDRHESVLVSEEFIRQFGWKDSAIGKRILWKDSLQLFVVGVVKNIYTDAFWKPVAPVMLRYVAPEQYKQIVVSTSPDRLIAVNDFMRSEWKKVSPYTLYEGRYTDGNLRITELINTNVVKIFGFLGVVAALMSATGLFALLSLSIVKRMKEIGVRKVLGASSLDIAGTINKEFMLILALATALGSALGYLMADKMMDAVWEYYRRIAFDTIGVCGVALFLVAAVTVGYKTIVTARMNPVSALKEE